MHADAHAFLQITSYAVQKSESSNLNTEYSNRTSMRVPGLRGENGEARAVQAQVNVSGSSEPVLTGAQPLA